MSFTRMTSEERRLIYAWKQDGKSMREMARLLGRDASSISREIRRNTGERGYRPKQAQEMADARAKRAGPRLFTEEIRLEVEAKLCEG